jgi:hypothetical protein
MQDKVKYCSASRSAASVVEDTRCRLNIRTYAKNLFDISVSDRCQKEYVIDECTCRLDGGETCEDNDYDDKCQATCCDKDKNYRSRARNFITRIMSNEYVNRCWCEWANMDSCKERFTDGSRCSTVCCNYVAKTIQRDESRMEQLLDYLDRKHPQHQIVSDDDNDDDEEEEDPRCDCGWANRRSCRHDDGTVCHYACCPHNGRLRHARKKIHKPKKQHSSITSTTLVDELRSMLYVQRRSKNVLIPT